jgi:linoleoyl-CoA desaturase
MHLVPTFIDHVHNKKIDFSSWYNSPRYVPIPYQSQVKGGCMNTRSVKFLNRSDFHDFLTERVGQYFKDRGLSPHATRAQIAKVFILFVWLFVSYGSLVFLATTWWQVVPLVISTGLAAACIGFCVQHDGNHGAFSRHKWVNKLMAYSLDFIGGSSYLWERKHNGAHHTNPNIAGHDDDIDVGILGRMAPSQPRLWFHRWQHIYMLFLYGFLVPKWQLFDDFFTVIRGGDGTNKVKRPRGMDLAVFIGGKLLFLTWAFVIPCQFHPFLLVVTVYSMTSWFMGVVLAVVFQQAHVVEETKFPLPQMPSGKMEFPWAEHQVWTTANFAPRSRVLTWLLGGLNFQIEHHLFPKMAHAHYSRISPIVREVCKMYGLPYNCHPTIWAAIRSHFRHLRAMGRPGS